MDERDWQRIQRMMDERVRDWAQSSEDPNTVAIHLQRLVDGQDAMRVDLLGVKEEVRSVKEYQKAQNGRVDQIDLTLAAERGARQEREKWEQRQAANIKWFVGLVLPASLALAGLIFGAVDRLTQ